MSVTMRLFANSLDGRTYPPVRCLDPASLPLRRAATASRSRSRYPSLYPPPLVVDPASTFTIMLFLTCHLTNIQLSLTCMSFASLSRKRRFCGGAKASSTGDNGRAFLFAPSALGSGCGSLFLFTVGTPCKFPFNEIQTRASVAMICSP
jgi:hypothetical protein